MGLDMWLHKRNYVKAWDHTPKGELIEITITKGGVPLPFKNIVYVIEEIMYWRKSNYIHNWFVVNVKDGIDDCKDAEVTGEDLTKLLNVCKEVAESLKNGFDDKSVALDLLPPSEGFFFGSYSIDDWYLNDIKNTINVIETLMIDGEISGDFIYQSSW